MWDYILHSILAYVPHKDTLHYIYWIWISSSYSHIHKYHCGICWPSFVPRQCWG